MARTDDDTWDLATGFGTTAKLVAVARALASREDDPLVTDLFADPLYLASAVRTVVFGLNG